MDVAEAIRTRKSIRAFKPKQVKKEILREILEIAKRAPSAVNTQPWKFTVITGNVLENIKRANVEMLNSGAPIQLEHLDPGSVYRERQMELGKEIFRLMGIQRQDKDKRARWMERGFRYFDAPVAIIISVDSSIKDTDPELSIGAVVENICLVALNYGLGTCIEKQGVIYPEVLRKFAGIPERRLIITSIAIGYPDWDFPANKLESTRERLENITTWCGFE